MGEKLNLASGVAQPADAAFAAQWIFQSDPPYYQYWFGSAAAALACLEKLWQAGQGSLGYGAFQQWQGNGQLVALAAHYHAGQDARLAAEDAATLPLLRGDLALLQRRLATLNWLFPHIPDDVWYLRTLVVDATGRGQGIGAQVLADIATQARSHGAVMLHTDVDSGNPGAVNFYRQQGFEVIAETRVPMLEAHQLPASLRMVKSLV